jgi:hypothetical protein
MSKPCGCGCGEHVNGRFAKGHNRRLLLDLTRFVEEDRGHGTPCHIWTSSLTPDGYGRIQIGGRTIRAHRATYTERHGAIPDGLQIDHLCRQKACVNPDHLEAVTSKENTRRHYALQTHCKYGHPLSGENLRILVGGYRACRICRHAMCSNRRRRLAEAARQGAAA